MGYPLPNPFFYAEDAYGNPLAGGSVATYEAGTDIELPTYSDADLTVENDNPVVLDENGRARIFVAAGTPYKVIIKDAAGALVWSEDDLIVPSFAAPAPAEGLPPGVVVDYTGDVAPAGWALCDGAAYGRTDPLYAALFAVIGVKYGAGNGSTTFNVPNTQQRFSLGKAVSGTGSVLGQTGGTIDHLHTGPAHTHTIPAHTHTVPAHTHTVPRDGWGAVQQFGAPTGRLNAYVSTTGPGYGDMATQDNNTGANTAQVTSAQALVTDSSGGGNTGTANPPYIVFNKIVKL